MSHLARLILGALIAMLLATTAFAQIKPQSSGALSFNAPQMRRHGSGLHRPNRPHHHHHQQHSFYR